MTYFAHRSRRILYRVGDDDGLFIVYAVYKGSGSLIKILACCVLRCGRFYKCVIFVGETNGVLCEYVCNGKREKDGESGTLSCVDCVLWSARAYLRFHVLYVLFRHPYETEPTPSNSESLCLNG